MRRYDLKRDFQDIQTHLNPVQITLLDHIDRNRILKKNYFEETEKKVFNLLNRSTTTIPRQLNRLDEFF